MPAYRVLPPHPTDPNSKHDDLYNTKAEISTTYGPTVLHNRYTKQLASYASLAAAIADLPDAGVNGGEILVDGEIAVASTQSVPSKVNLVGRGSGSSALIAPAGVSTPVLDIDGESTIALHGFSILKSSGSSASGTGYAIRVRGAATDILLDDLFGDEFISAVHAAGADGTTPGTIERLSLRNVRASRSPTNWGFLFDDVDGLNAVDCHSFENWLDGWKLRKKSKNVTVIGGSGNDNGQGYLANPALYAGDGLDAYAGGDTFKLIGWTGNGNYGSGIQIKTGPLTRDDAANYGYVRDMDLSALTLSNNSVAYGMLLNVNDPGDLTQPMVPNVTISGGIARSNALGGWYINARNVTGNGMKAVRNLSHGFSTGERAMDVVLNSPISIANGYPSTTAAHGMAINGTNITINSPLVIGRDADDIHQESDYSGTIYTNHAISISATAAGTITVNDPSFRHCSQNKVYPAGAIAGKLMIRASGAGAPNTIGVFGDPGSRWVQTDATGKQVVWDKLTGVSNVATGWSPVLHGAAPRTAALNFGSIAAGASETLTITFSVADGLATTDMALVTPPSTLDAGLIVTAWVGSTTTVSIRLYNATAAPIDPASGTWIAATVKV